MNGVGMFGAERARVRVEPGAYTSAVYVDDERVCSASVGPGTDATLAEVKRQADAWTALYEHSLLRLHIPQPEPPRFAGGHP